MASSTSCGTRFFSTDFLRLILQRQLTALVVQFLEPVEAVHHLAGLTDVAELLGKLQQSNLGADDLLFARNGVLQTPRRGASSTRQAIQNARQGAVRGNVARP